MQLTGTRLALIQARVDGLIVFAILVRPSPVRWINACSRRPTYPPQLYEAIYNFAALKGKDVALDIATGSGQAAKVLAESFTKVCWKGCSGRMHESWNWPAAAQGSS